MSALVEVADTDTVNRDVGQDSCGDSKNQAPAIRKKAVRILKNLSREIVEQDIPEAEKTCSCCGEALSLIGSEASEHLADCPASLKIIETRRKKYACGSCHGEIKRAALPKDVPLAKSMASASLLAFLIVAKFDDGLPLYRISRRLERLGIELSDALMSDWLIQCAPLLEELHRRRIRKVLDSGHVFTDDTILVTLSAIDGEIRDINIRLEDKDKEKPLGKKERDALMFRLGVLTVERVNAQRAYEDARYRARDL